MKASKDVEVEKIRKYAIRLRAAIDRVKNEHPEGRKLPFISHWPLNCCDSPFVFLMLYEMGYRGMIRKCASVSHYGKEFGKHVWIEVNGIDVDITADQFPDISDKVIVSRNSAWHSSLLIIDRIRWAEDEKKRFYDILTEDKDRIYERLLPDYATPFDSIEDAMVEA